MCEEMGQKGFFVLFFCFLNMYLGKYIKQKKINSNYYVCSTADIKIVKGLTEDILKNVII